MPKIQKGSIHNLLFRALVDAMTKFPLSSALAGSELVHMALTNDALLAHGGSTVRSKAQVKGQGAFDWISVDVRVLQPFAALVQSQVTAIVDEAGKQIKFTAGKRELTVPYASGSPYAKAGGGRAKMTIDLSEEDAKRLSYLADVASEDESRPDLNCVVIDTIEENKFAGVAGNQRSMAMAFVTSFEAGGILPLVVAQKLQKGDRLALVTSAQGQVATQLQSTVGTHMAPLMDKNREFPIASVQAFLASPRIQVGHVSGDDFVQAFNDCKDCLGFITKTGAFVKMTFSEAGLQLNAKNGGGASFRTSIDATAKKETDIFLPLDEVVRAARLFTGSKMTFSLGKVNGEVFMTSDNATVVVAPWKME